jgi:hypothetical protein
MRRRTLDADGARLDVKRTAEPSVGGLESAVRGYSSRAPAFAWIQ